MKGKIILLLILIIAFIIFIIFRFIFFDVQNTDGQLRIVSSPTASIFVNNVVVGKTPFDLKYKSGEYSLKLIPEATATATWQRKIKVYKKAITYINIELGSTDFNTTGVVFNVVKSSSQNKKDTGELSIESEPPNALVYLVNDEKGVSSLELADITKGDHELSVFMPGFIRHTQKVNINSGYKVNAYVKLAIDPSQNPPLKNDEIKEATPSPVIQTISKEGPLIIIKGTPDGWLRVRQDPSINASEAARVNEGDTFQLLEEKGSWIKISYDGTNEGWVSGEYVEKK